MAYNARQKWKTEQFDDKFNKNQQALAELRRKPAEDSKKNIEEREEASERAEKRQKLEHDQVQIAREDLHGNSQHSNQKLDLQEMMFKYNNVKNLEIAQLAQSLQGVADMVGLDIGGSDKDMVEALKYLTPGVENQITQAINNSRALEGNPKENLNTIQNKAKVLHQQTHKQDREALEADWKDAGFVTDSEGGIANFNEPEGKSIVERAAGLINVQKAFSNRSAFNSYLSNDSAGVLGGDSKSNIVDRDYKSFIARDRQIAQESSGRGGFFRQAMGAQNSFRDNLDNRKAEANWHDKTYTKLMQEREARRSALGSEEERNQYDNSEEGKREQSVIDSHDKFYVDEKTGKKSEAGDNDDKIAGAEKTEKNVNATGLALQAVGGLFSAVGDGIQKGVRSGQEMIGKGKGVRRK